MSLEFTKAWSLSSAASVTSLSDVSRIWKDTFGAVTRRAAKSRSRPKTVIQIKIFFQIFRRLKLIFMIVVRNYNLLSFKLPISLSIVLFNFRQSILKTLFNR